MQFSRTQLAELLWPQVPYELSRLRLRQELNRLKKALGDQSRIIETVGESVRITPNFLVTDVHEIDRHLAEDTFATSPEQRLESLRKAYVLIGQSFMDPFDDEWVRLERIRLNVVGYDIAVKYATALVEAERYLDADLVCRTAIDRVPDRESAYLIQIQTLTKLGQLQEARMTWDRLQSQSMESNKSPASETPANDLLGAKNLTSFESTVGLRYTYPAPSEPLIGRDQQLSEIVNYLDPHKEGFRIVTVQGMGGVGKTHLLRYACLHLGPIYNGRVAYVDLSDLTDADSVPIKLLQALGLGNAPTEDPTARLVRALANRVAVLVLDNLEQFGPSIQPLISILVRDLPMLRLIAGSRSRLHLEESTSRDEISVALLPLDVPQESAEHSLAMESTAVQFFLHAVEADQIGTSINPSDWPTIANIVRRLDGIPLAMQLAASRMRTLGPGGLLQELEKGFNSLVNRREDAPVRHRTMRNAIAASFEPLAPELLASVASLSVFRGGWTEESAAEVCEIPDPSSILQKLVDASLIYVLRDLQPPRYRMLESIREHVVDLLPEADRRRLQQNHLDWIIRRSSKVAEELVDDEIRKEFDRLDDEFENIREATRFAFETNSRAAFELGGNLAYFWLFRTSGYEPHRFYESLFERYGDSTVDSIVARAAYGRALSAHFLPARNREDIFSRSLDMVREVGEAQLELRLRAVIAFNSQSQDRFEDTVAQMRAIDQIVALHGTLNSDGFLSRLHGLVVYLQGDPARAVDYFQESVDWFNRRGEFYYQTRSRMFLCYSALDAGLVNVAEEALEGVYERAAEVGLGALTYGLRSVRGRVHLARARYEAAEEEFKRGLRAWQEIGSPIHEVDVWNCLGRTYLRMESLSEAQATFGESADLALANDFIVWAAVALVGLAATQAQKRQYARAARLLSVAKREWSKADAKLRGFHRDFANEVETDILRSLEIDSLPESSLTLHEAVQLGHLT